MVYNENREDKTYEERMAEALLQIPLYCPEWTNFNPSDPGITILENLTAFETLQQDDIGQITPAIRQMLLKMAGFEAAPGRCARVFLAPLCRHKALELSANEKFMAGDLCFETKSSLKLPPYGLTGIYGARDGKTYDYSRLLDREVHVPAFIFGDSPKAGDSLWLMADGLPDAGEELMFYVTAKERPDRNPPAKKGQSVFADVKWECYTEQGFAEMESRDSTAGFVFSGEVRLRMPKFPAMCCPSAPGGGYGVRATLKRADYDIKPGLTMISGFLFQVWQMETRAACYEFDGESEASLSGSLLEEGYVTVFCREGQEDFYRQYAPAWETGEKGRFYREVTSENHMHSWQFDRRHFGYGPGAGKASVRIVAYDQEMMRQYVLGTVMGSDGQMMELPGKHIVADSFCILAKRTGKDGEEIFDFFKPGCGRPGDLTYCLYEEEGKIMIENPGAFTGADLYVGALSITRGKEGNIRPGNRFDSPGLLDSPGFYNPGEGEGGAFRETLEEVKQRFLQDLKQPYTAVTAADYERLVKETPQLCIHKVRAFMDRKRNAVRIAVKPGTDEEFPGLPKTYQAAIERQLEARRLLNTRIEIVPPVYVPVDVRGTIYVKRRYENSREQIEKAARKAVDWIHSGRNFGEILRFDQVFHEIESLDCVEFICELFLIPQNPELARLEEPDIIPIPNGLCCGGDIVLELC